MKLQIDLTKFGFGISFFFFFLCLLSFLLAFATYLSSRLSSLVVKGRVDDVVVTGHSVESAVSLLITTASFLEG